MRIVVLGALLLASANVADAQQPSEPPKIVSVSVVPDDVDPDRFREASVAVNTIVAPGSYGKTMQDMMTNSMSSVMNPMLDMSEADMVDMVCKGDDKSKNKDCDKKKVSKGSIRDEIRKEDPAFDERMRITAQVFGEEFGRIGAIIEPGLREGLARSLAKRFTLAQLQDVNRFLATPSGKAFGTQLLPMWVDPEVMKSVMGSMPQLMQAMPEIMKKVEAATAHLPKPKKHEDAAKPRSKKG